MCVCFVFVLPHKVQESQANALDGALEFQGFGSAWVLEEGMVPVAQFREQSDLLQCLTCSIQAYPKVSYPSSPMA